MLNCSKENLTLLQKTQNRAMRAILMVNMYMPVRGMLYVLNFMSVREKINFNVCVFVYKMKNGLTPEYLNHHVTTVSEFHDYNTRNKDKIRINRTKTVAAEKSLIYRGFKLYNELPREIINAENVEKFKWLLKEYVFKKRVELYECD